MSFSRAVGLLLISQACWTDAASMVRKDSRVVSATGEISEDTAGLEGEMYVTANGEVHSLEHDDGDEDKGSRENYGLSLLDNSDMSAEEMLTQVQNLFENTDLTAEDGDKIKVIKDLVQKELLPALKKDHSTAQTQVNSNIASISKCNSQATSKRDKIQKTTVPTVDGLRSTHATCREEEIKKETTKNGACGKLDAALNAINVPGDKPSERDAAVKYVSDESTYFCNQGPQIKVMDEACTKSEKEHSEHQMSCNKNQAAFEMGFCTFRTQLTDECVEFTGCYDDAVKAYQTHLAATLELVKKWKTEFKSLHKIVCYTDVWMNNNDAKSVDASQYEKCKTTEADDSEMDIKKGEVPAKNTCDLKPVETHPGTSNFPTVEYAKFSKYAITPIACLPTAPTPATPPAQPPAQPPATPPPTPAPTPEPVAAVLWGHINCDKNGGDCNLAGVVGSSTWPDCKSGVQHRSSGTNRCWQGNNLEVAKKICEAHEDCVGLTRDNHGWEPRRGPTIHNHVAAHELMLKANHHGYSRFQCSKGNSACNLAGVVGSSTWSDCKSGVQHAASGSNRCWQGNNLEVARKICNNHADCMGLTRDNHGWEPRRGPSLNNHVAAHELMLKGK